MFEKDSSEAMIELAKAGIPVVPMSMALCGSTAPTAIAGTLIIVNAENLAALLILQCANPCAPKIYCAESTSADMRTGGINYRAPELPFSAAGTAQMARFYILPCYATQCGLDESPDSLQALIERSKWLALAHLSHGDISGGLGSLEIAESAALEQIILDLEAWKYTRAYLHSFEVNKETLAFQAISEVGPGGNFLGLKHTLEHFQKEIWLKKERPFLSQTDGSLLERVKEKVREILSSHIPPQLDDELKREIAQILRNCEKDKL
jgi:trimethylamine--corrinoid protein Co-methyltransferase